MMRSMIVILLALATLVSSPALADDVMVEYLGSFKLGTAAGYYGNSLTVVPHGFAREAGDAVSGPTLLTVGGHIDGDNVAEWTIPALSKTAAGLQTAAVVSPTINGTQVVDAKAKYQTFESFTTFDGRIWAQNGAELNNFSTQLVAFGAGIDETWTSSSGGSSTVHGFGTTLASNSTYGTHTGRGIAPKRDESNVLLSMRFTSGTTTNQVLRGTWLAGTQTFANESKVFDFAGVTKAYALEYVSVSGQWYYALAAQQTQAFTLQLFNAATAGSNATPDYTFTLSNDIANGAGWYYSASQIRDLAWDDENKILYALDASNSGGSKGGRVHAFRLFLPDYEPDAVTDLRVSGTDWYKVELAWTAPADHPPGPVDHYDLRMSMSPITDDASFGAATPITSPVPAAPGTTQTFAVTGLTPETTYYFALKAHDAGGLVSALSNTPVSGTTGLMDVTAPAATIDLAASEVRPIRATLSWTAPADDGSDPASGAAAVYDVRYSTTPITDDVSFAAATAVAGVAAPQAPGSIETFTLRDLSPQTTYYVALKTTDEVPLTSPLSNIVTFTTPPAPVEPPAAITDLQLLGTHIRSAYLNWTAPAAATYGVCATYDVRYSTSPIDEANWETATPVTGEPVSAPAGATENFTVTGLQPETVYYFAVKTLDESEPPLISALSNSVSGQTITPVPPLVIHNPWLVNDRVADCRTLQTMAATFDKQYTPNGVIVPDPADIETRAINEYNNFKRRMYHWGEMPSDNRDAVSQMNVFGWALCGSHASMNAAILEAMGLTPRTISIAGGGHTYYEVQYNGKWHALDTMTTFYVYDRNTPRSLVSMADVKADKTLVYNAVADGRACPGFLLCGDTPQYFADGSDSWGVLGQPGSSAADKSMNMDLRIGEALTRTGESWATQHINTNPPYHHESQNDWKDSVNLPYWEPYGMNTAENATIGISKSMTYRRWANGTIVLAPDFTSQAYTAGLVSSSNIATVGEDGLAPELHVAATGAPATAVFRIVTPFYLTDLNVAGVFRRSGTSDVNRVYVSADGAVWTQIWDNTAIGTTQVSNLNGRTQVYGKYQAFVKVELQATTAISDAGVSGLTITATFEHNKGGMAYLDKGVNNITLTFDNPQDLTASTAIKVTYRWKENHGAGWTVDGVHEEEIATSPATFSINVGGTKVPRTESITVEVVQSVPDVTAPKPIGDLAATLVDSTRVDLAWTASGDDYDQGTATSYDLRYSTSPITAGNFDAATPATGLPAPKMSGAAESFTLTGLAPSTTYWLAIKAVDNAGNASGFANAISITTLAPDVTPPATILDLTAQAGTQSGSVLLSWNAPGDDGATGMATGYELRYQPQAAGPITTANWSSATVIAGLPAPQAAGAAEQFTVTGLTWGARYYFAIVASDEVPNASSVSNSPLGTATSLGEVALQDGLNGYAGCRDNYMYVGNPATNYGGSSLMRVTGYGAAQVQRPLVRFDLSSIPASLPITRATLWLYSNNPAQVKGSTGFYGAYKLTRDWGETTSSWSSPWTTPGGDFDAAADALAPKQSSAAAPCWYAFDVTDRVQAWINDPSDNYGWLIKCTDENLNNQDEFVSSDAPDADHRPKLVISDLAAEDTIAPAAVTNLAAADGSDGTIEVTWTATGDDGTTGTAWRYDLRYTTDAQGPISEANWATAQVVSGISLPQAAGSTESFVVTGLLANQTYHFGLKIEDEAGNSSGLSNVTTVFLAQGPRTVVLDASKDGPMYGLVVGGNTNRGLGGRYDLTVGSGDTVNSVLMQFDLSDLVGPQERIESASLELFSVRQDAGVVWDLDLRAYPLLDNWVEGIGTTDGIVGSTSSPWVPASIGDAVYSYRQVAAVAPEPTWGNYDAATAGVPWAVAGARGIGTDVADSLMVSEHISGVGHVLGAKLCTLPLTSVGIDVMNEWGRGIRANHGLNLFPLSTGTGFIAAGTREFDTAAWRTKLTLTIVPSPAGDVTGDGHVDVVDLLYLVESFGKVSGEAGFNRACDFNRDDSVDVVDLLTMVENFGM